MSYDVLSLLGQGTYGKVYKVKNNEMIYAAKKIKYPEDKEYPEDREFIHLNYSEFEMLKKLDHPNIIKYVEHFYNRHYAILITECFGTQLENVHLFKNQIREVMKQILNALEYLHKDYIHRDLSVRNILTNGNQIKIIDFGASTSKNTCHRPVNYCNLWFAAPEMLLNMNEYSTEVDMWSVGVIFYYLINNRVISHGEDLKHQLLKYLHRLGIPENTNLNKNKYMINILENFEQDSKWKIQCFEDPIAYDLFLKFVEWDSFKRISASDALQHEYFS